VAVVAGVLLDHADVDPAEADRLLHEAARVGQGAAGNSPTRLVAEPCEPTDTRQLWILG
jgi:hypothetical protein